jgi:hypothetical protein
VSIQVDECGSSSLKRFVDSPWPILLILALATILRAWKLTEWSMWEDEEGSVYFSQRPERPFARLLPVFFVALHAVYQVTGVTVAAGRIFSAGIGILGILLLYTCFRRLISRRVAILSALLVAVSLGHLFWSQSIRYYNLVVVFELLSMYWFLTGFEHGKYGYLLLSHIALVLALLTHFSAVLLAPVYIGYLALMAIRREAGGAYNLKGYLGFGLSLAIIVGFFAWKLRQAQEMFSNAGGGLPSARDPAHVLVTLVAYFSLPVVALAFLSPFVPPRQVTKRVLWFFIAASVIPVLELLVIAQLNVINVAWYYALVALSGFAVLASFSLVGLYERGYWRSASLAGSAVGTFSAMLLVGYYTNMSGDRPRWEEATNSLRQRAAIQMGAGNNSELFASVPGVVAFYLGVNPGETKGNPLVQMVPTDPPTHGPVKDQWYIVEVDHISPKYQAWLESHCVLTAAFEAHTGPRDRTVCVYHYQASRDTARTRN